MYVLSWRTVYVNCLCAGVLFLCLFPELCEYINKFARLDHTPWGYQDMGTLSKLLALCEGNPPWGYQDMGTLSKLLALCEGNPPWGYQDMGTLSKLLALCEGNPPWGCQDMGTLSKLLALCEGNPPWGCQDIGTLSKLLALCEGNPPVDSPHKGPVMWNFDVFFVVSQLDEAVEQTALPVIWNA